MSFSEAKLRKIAADALRDFERKQVPHDLLMSLYMAQYPDADELQKCIAMQRALLLFPRGVCTLGSLLLHHRTGYKGQVGIGFFVEGRKDHIHRVLDLGQTALGDQTIMDITCHQFRNGPRAFVGQAKEPWIVKAHEDPLRLPLPRHTRHESLEI